MSEEPQQRLTDRQRLFVERYLQHWNASRAAREAGYVGRSDVVGPRLLVNVGIQAEISHRLEVEAMSANEVLHRLADHARGTPEDFLKLDEETGEWQLDLPAARRAGRLHLLKKLKSGKDGISFELYDSQAALEKLARAHGLLKDRHEVSGPDGGPMRFSVRPDLSGCSDEELALLERILSRTNGAAVEVASGGAVPDPL